MINKQDVFIIAADSYRQGGEDAIASIIESFTATAKVLKRNSFTLDEITGAIAIVRKHIEEGHAKNREEFSKLL